MELNVVCFRYVGAPGESGGPGETLDEVNQEIVVELHERGLAVPSYTVVNGRFVIRVAISNHRTRTEDLDAPVEQVVELGNDLDRTEVLQEER